MNRAERRRKSKEGVTDKDLKAIQDRAKAIAIRESVRVYSTAVAMVLRDKLGFGQVRIERTLKDISDLADAMNEGYVSVDDCRKTLYEEVGVLLVTDGRND